MAENTEDEPVLTAGKLAFLPQGWGVEHPALVGTFTRSRLTADNALSAGERLQLVAAATRCAPS